MKLETRDLAAVILAIGVSLTVVLIGISTVVHSTSISISEATLLGTVLGTVVGGLATFMGYRARDSQVSNVNNHSGDTWPGPQGPLGRQP
jgi:hypothetical protein